MMNMQQPSSLIIDPEVSALFLPPDPYFTSIIKQNIRMGLPPAPFPVWNDILMDRLNEYKEYVDTGIQIKTQPLFFTSKDTMLAFICQMLATGISKTTHYKMYLIGKHYQYYKAAYYRSEVESPHNGLSRSELKERYSKDIHKSIVALVDTYDISPTTVHYFSRFASAIDSIRGKDEHIGMQILSGQIKIPKNKIIELKSCSTNELQRYIKMVKHSSAAKISTSKIPGNRPVEIDPSHKEHLDNRIIPEIKQMPKYDPDAAVSSLALTVPSWTDSIRRVKTRSNLSEVSAGAADNLIFQLGILENTIQIIKNELEGITKDAN